MSSSKAESEVSRDQQQEETESDDSEVEKTDESDDSDYEEEEFDDEEGEDDEEEDFDGDSEEKGSYSNAKKDEDPKENCDERELKCLCLTFPKPLPVDIRALAANMKLLSDRIINVRRPLRPTARSCLVYFASIADLKKAHQHLLKIEINGKKLLVEIPQTDSGDFISTKIKHCNIAEPNGYFSSGRPPFQSRGGGAGRFSRGSPRQSRGTRPNRFFRGGPSFQSRGGGTGRFFRGSPGQSRGARPNRFFRGGPPFQSRGGVRPNRDFSNGQKRNFEEGANQNMDFSSQRPFKSMKLELQAE